MTIKALATDLDGTLVPLDGNTQNRDDLKTVESILETHGLSLVFVTGRHFESTEQAMLQYNLPRPDWIICDVGTTILRRSAGGQFEVVTAYSDHLAAKVSHCPAPELTSMLSDHPALRLQESEKLGPFKVSFYARAADIQATTNQLAEQLRHHNAPWSIISSVDPFNGDGLIDLLPVGVSKAFAINWWAAERRLNAEQLVFAGDSGNDIAALTAGYRAVVVGNATADVKEEARASHHSAAWTGRLFISEHSATSGVVDGLQYFLNGATPPTGLPT